jgi:PAS domain S-box-containing protein
MSGSERIHPWEIAGDQRANILLVDDRSANLIALGAVLEPLGQNLLYASSGDEALGLLLQNEVAVILMDVQMPSLNGIETAALIQAREKSRHIPIIFLTASSADPGHILAGYAHGGVDYLVKPFDDDILRRKVWIFVQLHLKERALRERERMLREAELKEALRKNEVRFRALVDAMPQCVIAARAHGEIYYRNRLWKEYTGLSEEETRSSGYLAAVHPEDRGKLAWNWKRATESGDPFEIDVRLRRASDGQYRWHRFRGVPEHDETGVTGGWIATATDVDVQRRLDEERRELLVRAERARELAETANRMKDEFLATVSHELRNPLQAILGWTRILRQESIESDQLKKALETIERNARAQTQLIEDILDVSRIITGKLRIDYKLLSLNQVINAAIETVLPAARAKGVRVEATLDPRADRASGDINRLQQVVWNLLSNAIKFTPSGGLIEVCSNKVESHVELSVSDTGKGIEANFLPFVFERFRQADGTSTRSHGGLGLGLAIVRHLVELHGGTVDVASDGKDRGTTFTVMLPVRAVNVPFCDVPKRETPTRGLIAFEDVPSLEGIKVLVVDDDVDARELLSTVLEQFGAKVMTASSVDEALKALAAAPLDVLVSDIGMPREDGFTLIRKIRQLEHRDLRRIPAVALTGFARIEDEQRAIEEGFQLHVAKPVDPAQLVLQVATLTGRMSSVASRN